MTRTVISLASILPTDTRYRYLQALVPVLDRLLGLKRLNLLFSKHQMADVPLEEFSSKALDVLQIKVGGAEQLELQLPLSGAALIVANHPLGGLEGIALASVLTRLRTDVKFLGNNALAAVKELSPLFIYTNPLVKNSKGNLSSLRACKRHLADGGMLVIFPAGRVSYYDKARHYITDHDWHRMVGQLAQQADLQIIPLFVAGHNSRLFHLLGRVYYRFRLLMLVREMLRSQGMTIPFHAGNSSDRRPPAGSFQAITDHYRLLCYLHNPDYQHPWGTPPETKVQALATPQSGRMLADEIAALPADQHLFNYKNFSVCYGFQAQIPTVIAEIQRLREKNFRSLDEGSGQPFDGDAFDNDYTHLFVFDNESQGIIGAYRMGQTDRLTKTSGMSSLYLSRMFKFSPQFPNHSAPCLEMGRSFVTQDSQRSFHGLFLLFRGIGAFVCRFPQYRTLYGTVSLSKQYQPISVYLIQRMLTGSDAGNARPLFPFKYPANPEIDRFLSRNPESLQSLEWLVRQLEPDGKGLPVLLKQYHQLGAKFHCVGIDPNFAATPGLLLSVNLPDAPERALKRYLGESWQSYLDFK